MATALRKEQIDTISTASRREKSWTAARRELRLACSQQFTEEEIAHFECLGLSSWESR